MFSEGEHLLTLRRDEISLRMLIGPCKPHRLYPGYCTSANSPQDTDICLGVNTAGDAPRLVLDSQWFRDSRRVRPHWTGRIRTSQYILSHNDPQSRLMEFLHSTVLPTSY